MKNKKGITLISLIVTIIILIILAGLTLTFALNKSGILTKAQYAKDASTNAQIQEETGLNNLDKEITNKTNSSGPKPVINNEYDYTGSVQQFTVPYSGTYKLEVWGASGGTVHIAIGGNGGYSTGLVSLTQGDMLNIYVGGAGTNTYGGGWNGGGNKFPSVVTINGNTGSGYAGGGGATDIRLNGDNLTNRIIVAGGGGGAGYADNANYGPGGCAGGLSGNSGGSDGHEASPGQGGTQNSGGLGGVYTPVYSYGGYNGQIGELGKGADGPNNGGICDTPGGGGGYYGGGSGSTSCYWGTGGGGGGSSYIGGVQKGITIAGNQSMPSSSGSTEVGHSGNGCVKITLI